LNRNDNSGQSGFVAIDKNSNRVQNISDQFVSAVASVGMSRVAKKKNCNSAGESKSYSAILIYFMVFYHSGSKNIFCLFTFRIHEQV
jgi:hypothetical protein